MMLQQLTSLDTYAMHIDIYVVVRPRKSSTLSRWQSHFEQSMPFPRMDDSDLVFVDGDAAAEAFEDFEDLKEVDLRKEESTQVWHLDILFDAINVTLYTIWKWIVLVARSTFQLPRQSWIMLLADLQS